MDYKQLVKDKEGELNDLFKRMDNDKDLLYLSKYTLKDKDGKEIKGVISTTLNDPAVFAANVLSSLGATTEQIVVEGEDLKDKQTTYIEEFLEVALSSANDRLRLQGRPDLTPFFDEQLCIRGRAGFRCVFQEVNGVMVPDVIPIDTRYFTYEMGVDGMEWGAYKTTRSKAKIKAEYEIDISGKQAIVQDIWARDHFEVYVDDKKVNEDNNPFGYVPFGIQVVSLGSMLLDKDSLSHYGESIFFLIRDLIPELNRLVSILQTINMATVKAPKQWATKQGVLAEAPEGADELGAWTAIEIGGGISLVPIADIKNATRLLHNMIDTRIQAGSLSRLDLGTLTFPLSAVALVEIGESRDQIFLPRLQAKALLNQQLADMIISQCELIGGTIELGTQKHKRKFQVNQLKGEFDIKYRYFTKSPKTDIARYSIAAAAGDLLSNDTKRRDILHLQDPDGEKQKIDYEVAAKVSPSILRARIIKSLIEQDETFEAELMAAEMGVSLEQIMRGEVPKEEPPVEKPRAPKETLPLFSEGASSAKKAAELGAEPRAEEGGE